MFARLGPSAIIRYVLLLAACALVSACGVSGGSAPTPTPQPSPQVTPTTNPLASAAITLVERSMDTYVSRSLASNVSIPNQTPSADLPHYSGGNPYPALAYGASALSRASLILRASDPTRAATYTTYASRIADYLVQHKDDNGDGKTAWGLPGAWDAFQDGTENPANTDYAFQTGLVSDALIDVYLVSPNPTYLQTAKDGIATFLPLSSASVDATCANCRYFWYSANANDFSRFVKNTNLLLGSVLARLALITRDAAYMTPAEQVYVTEQYEIASRANFRYLGYNDPKYSPSGVMDAHLATEIWALNDIALALTAMGSSSGSNRQQLLTAMAAAFWQCGDTCKASLTTDYGVRVACELAPDDISARQQCQQAVDLYNAPGARVLNAFPILGVLRYLTLFGYHT